MSPVFRFLIRLAVLLAVSAANLGRCPEGSCSCVGEYGHVDPTDLGGFDTADPGGVGTTGFPFVFPLPPNIVIDGPNGPVQVPWDAGTFTLCFTDCRGEKYEVTADGCVVIEPCQRTVGAF